MREEWCTVIQPMYMRERQGVQAAHAALPERHGYKQDNTIGLEKWGRCSVGVYRLALGSDSMCVYTNVGGFHLGDLMAIPDVNYPDLDIYQDAGLEGGAMF